MWWFGAPGAFTENDCWLCLKKSESLNKAELCEECAAMLRDEGRVVSEPVHWRTDQEKAI